MFKFIAPALAGIAIVSSPAMAKGQQDKVEVREVSVADLDLAKPEGQREMQARVRRAANSICADHRVRGLEARAQQAACAKAILSKTETQMATRIAASSNGG